MSSDTLSNILSSSVYNELLRHCKAAIAHVFKTRYEKMKSPNRNDKDQISLEITTLQRLSVHMGKRERSYSRIHIVPRLRARVFPSSEMLSFLKAVDMKNNMQMSAALVNLELTW